MKREILFRAVYYNYDKKTFATFREWRVMADDRNSPPYISDCFTKTHEQYTGLTDKNGIKIFEGDIVKHPGVKQPCIVRFEAGAFIVGYHNGSSTKRRPMLLSSKDVVIGNIHQNPELIK